MVRLPILIYSDFNENIRLEIVVCCAAGGKKLQNIGTSLV